MRTLRRNIRLLALALALLFGGLVAYFSYSVYFYGGRWFANVNNPRLANQKARVVAGDILDRAGLVLATSADGSRQYAQDSDIRRATAHVVGDEGGVVANGAETFMASYLLSFKSGALERVRQLFSGNQARGDDVTLTIDAKLCEYAASLLSRHAGGAIVLLNYRTGEILCSTSFPDFDPKNVMQKLSGEDDGALVNRVTQGLYPPGSTFKIITMTSALENLTEIAARRFHCTGTLAVSRTTITEASDLIHGSLSVRDAFAQSCNTAFATLSMELGYARIAKTAESFGIGDNFLFRDMVLYNSQFPTSNQSRDDLAWAGIGQGRVLATPLHMAMIAGAIANDGMMMEPRLLLSATPAQGQTRALLSARGYRRATSATVANLVTDYMLECVQRGTGTGARLDGFRVAGKTGSAETSDDKTIETHAWFVGFIDDASHPLAIAVVVEYGGSGGRVAAPIAGKVLQRAISLGY